MNRRSAVVGALALLSNLVASVTALTASARQATPYDPATLEGITIDRLAGSFRLPPLPADWTTVSLRRITFEPGSTLELPYAGPVLYYVESGTLGFRTDLPRYAISSPSGDTGPRGFPSGAVEGEITLTSGYGLYVGDGNIGPVRNPGDDVLVVLAVLLVPQPA